MDDPIQSFASAALDFCALLESTDSSKRFALDCLIALLQLHRCALMLPYATVSEEDAPLRPSKLAWDRVLDGLNARLAADLYWEGYEPFDFQSEPAELVAGSLSDDLAGIWRDVKEGLLELEDGRPQDAVWHWRFSFGTHWGRHSASAIRALHHLAADDFADWGTER